MIILNGFSCNLKTSVLNKFRNEVLCIESESVHYSKLRKLGLADYSVTPRLFSRYVLLKSLECTNAIIDRSLIDQLIFNDFVHKGLLDSYTPDHDKVFENTKTYIDLENSIQCKRVLILNHDMKMIKNIIASPDFKDSPRYDMFHSSQEYAWAQQDYENYYMNAVKPDMVLHLTEEMKSFEDKLNYLTENIKKLL